MSVDVTKPEKYLAVHPYSPVNLQPIEFLEEKEGQYLIKLKNGCTFWVYSKEKKESLNKGYGYWWLREKTKEELSKEANEYLDETLGTFNAVPNKDKPCDDLESSLKEDLQRVHEALKDSLLRVESQAFALFVKESKGTDIATDYYNFKKLASRFK